MLFLKSVTSIKVLVREAPPPDPTPAPVPSSAPDPTGAPVPSSTPDPTGAPDGATAATPKATPDPTGAPDGATAATPAAAPADNEAILAWAGFAWHRIGCLPSRTGGWRRVLSSIWTH